MTVGLAVGVETAAPQQRTLGERNAQAVADNPLLSNVESIKCLGTFINALASLHAHQQRYDKLSNDDFVGRMTQLRLMVGEADTVSRTFEPFTHSQDENIQQSAEHARFAFGLYKATFEQNVNLYEQLVRIFTIPHELTPTEASAIAEGRITASKLAATFTEASDLLKMDATLVFASAIVPAPGDHVALNMSAADKKGFLARLREEFGPIEKQSTLRGTDIAAFILMTHFEKDWLLAK